MRKVIVSFTALLLLAPAAQAQTSSGTASDTSTGQITAAPKPVSPLLTTGQVDFGIRGTDLSGDRARFERYRDIGNGGVFDQFRFNSDAGGWLFKAGADRVGRKDQRFWGEFLQVGKVRASFSYDQLPTWYSNTALTPYTIESPGVFRMDTAARQLLATNKTTLKNVFPSLASPVGLASSRDTAAFALSASPSKALDLNLKFTSVKKDGTMPYFASFGFSNAVELPYPIDNRTNDLSVKAEWTNMKGLVRVGYDGSWFANDIKSITWDNPLATTDRVYPSAYSDGRGPSYSRMATAPDSTRHMVSAAGSYKLPAHSRLSAYLGVGSVTSNAAILPYTTNTAAPVLELPRTNVNGDVGILSSNVNFTSRPNRYVWFNARYRYYDLNTRTEAFESERWVLFDGVLENTPLENETYSVKRRSFDADASFTPLPFGAFKVGFGRYESDRTRRIFEKTVDNVFRTSFDVTGNQYFSVRTLYERAVRDGEGFDEERLLEMNEQPGMRHYDVANRTRDRVTALVTATPVSFLGLNGSIAAGKDDYKDSPLGLRDNTNRVYTVGADLQPIDRIAFGVTYTYENYAALQRSRTANPPPSPQFNDPTRDWTTDSDDTTKTITANADFVKLLPRTDLRFGVDRSRGVATYIYGVVPGSAVPVPTQLPAITNELLRGTVDVNYAFTRRVSFGVVYWYDEYKVDDWALSPSTITGQADLPATLFLGYLYRPYKAHTGFARVRVLF